MRWWGGGAIYITWPGAYDRYSPWEKCAKDSDFMGISGDFEGCLWEFSVLFRAKWAVQNRVPRVQKPYIYHGGQHNAALAVYKIRVFHPYYVRLAVSDNVVVLKALSWCNKNTAMPRDLGTIPPPETDIITKGGR